MRPQTIERARNRTPVEYSKENLLKVPAVAPKSKRRQSAVRRRIAGAVLGTFAGWTESGEPLVDFDANASGGLVPARTTVAWEKDALGRQVILVFEGGDTTKPLLIGFVRPSRNQPLGAAGQEAARGQSVAAHVDGEKLVLTADREIVLCCGKASITLTRAGKILIRGEYLLSRSSGVNSIKGGVVQIN